MKRKNMQSAETTVPGNLDDKAMGLAGRIWRLLDGKKARDMVMLDVRGLSGATDYFILASGNSSPHLKAMYVEVQSALKKDGIPGGRRSGRPEGNWMVLDYGDIIVHMFSEELRAYYNLEELWAAAKRIVPVA